MLLQEPSANTGIIRLQTTPRYDSTMAISQSALRLRQRMKEASSQSKLSTPDPEEDTVTAGLGDTAVQDVSAMNMDFSSQKYG